MSKYISTGMMKYCVVANITKNEHPDRDGILRYGTKVFPAGRKVYLSRRLWAKGVVVLGLNRYRSAYAEDLVPLDLLENVRFSKVFNPRVLSKMVYNDEYMDMWWSYKDEDCKGAKEYADMINRIKSGEAEAFEKYNRDVMYQFYGN